MALNPLNSSNLEQLALKGLITLLLYIVITYSNHSYLQQSLIVNAKRPCDCSVLCLRPKSSQCSYPHYILDLTGHFRRISQVIRDNSQQPPLEWKGCFVWCGDIDRRLGYFVLSQYTHLTGGRTDGQNCDRNTVRCITCSRAVKTLQSYLTLNFRF